MAMSIGDAVIKFVGDTSSLDAAFQQIQEGSAAKLAPVAADAEAVSAAMDGVAQSASAAGAAMAGAGAEGTAAASTLSEAQTNVARLTYENQVAQNSLRSALRQVHATSGDVTSIIESLGQAQVRAAMSAEALAVAQKGVTTSANVMGTAMVEAGAETTFSMSEAKGEIALLGEETGVKMPRHLRGFLAEIPGVGVALNAVFGATAVLMIGQIFIEAGKKLYEFVMSCLEAGEKIRESWNKSTGELQKHNDELQVSNDKLDVEISKLEHKPSNMLKLALDEGIVSADKLAASLAKDSDEVDKLLKQNSVSTWKGMIGSLFGGSVDTGEQETLISKLAKEIKEVGVQGQIAAGNAKTDDERASAAASTKIALQKAYTGAIKETGDALNEITSASGKSAFNASALDAAKGLLQGYLTQLQSMQAGFNIQNANDQKAEDKAKLTQQTKHGTDSVSTAREISEAKLAAQKKTLDAQADLDIASTKLMLALGNISEHEAFVQQTAADQRKYDAAIGFQQKMLALLQKDPSKNAARIIAANAEIEALEKQHQAKLADIATKSAEQVNLIQKGLDNLKVKPVDFRPLMPTPDAILAIDKLEAAFAALGMTGGKMYESLSNKAVDAYHTVSEAAKSGAATELDVLVAQQHAIQAIIATEQQYGRSTVVLKQMLGDVTKEIAKATDATGKYNKAEQSVSGLMDQLHRKFAIQNDDLTKNQKVFNAIAGDMSNVFGSAVSSFVSGQETMGQALEKALAQYLANLAGKAAADALYFAAWGIADIWWDPPRSAGDFTAAGEFAALAAIAGGTAYGMSGGTSSSSSTSSSGSATSTATQASGNGITGSSGTAGTNPVQRPTVQHFAAGGLISKPTLAVIGDSITGAPEGDIEAILPLSNPQAMKAIAAAIAEHMGGTGGTTIINHNWNGGIIGMDNTKDFMKQMNKATEGGQHLLATVARRTERRS